MVTAGYLERDVSVNNLKLHFQEWGNPASPTILMLHGFGVSGHMFDEFAERMQDRFRLIAIDQRGHGDSDWSVEGDYTRDAFVADVEGFREALGLDQFILIGHSMGGLNAVSYAVAYPQRVRALVLVDVGPEAAKEGVDNIVRFTRGPDELDFDQFVEMAHRFNQRRTLENIRERMRHRLKPTESGKWTWKFDRRFREQDATLRIGSQLSNEETWNLYRSVTAPTLIVRGAESDVLTVEVAERAAREMQHARLVTVPAAGHSVPGDNPDDFTAAVTEFVGDVENYRFEPDPIPAGPTLGQLVEASEAHRRGPSLLTLLLAGVAAGAALTAAVLVMRSATGRKKDAGLRGHARSLAPRVAEPLRQVDVEAARRRAAELATDLAGVAQSGVARARSAMRDVDLERARTSALEVLRSLGDTTIRVAPAVARQTASRVDGGAIARRLGRGRRRSRRASIASAALGIATKLLAAPRPRGRSGRRLAVWRG